MFKVPFIAATLMILNSVHYFLSEMLKHGSLGFLLVTHRSTTASFDRVSLGSELLMSLLK